jgi:hypothetical protein
MKRSWVINAVCALTIGLAVMALPGTAAAAPSSNGSDDFSTTAATSAQIEAAIAYGMDKVNKSLYTGCSAGTYRFGTWTTYERHFDGRTCGQSYVWVFRPGYYGYDCSGLIYKMWQAAGVYFPYTSSSAMKDNVPKVSKTYIRRGDLLVKYGHVAMYLGKTSDGVPWALEASPKQVLEASGVYRVAKGVMAVDARPYLTSSYYTAHRV